MKTAIVHDYFNQNGGAEKTVEVMLEDFPESDIFTTLFYPKNFEDCPLFLKARKQGRVKTSFMQLFLANKWGIRFFKHFFWLYPLAMSTVVVDGYDLVLVSSSYPAKNVTIKNSKKILSYCHSPARFLNNMTRETEMTSINPVLRFFVPFFSVGLKKIDQAGAHNLAKLGARWFVNSSHMRKVVRDAYSVESEVLYPPVDTTHFQNLTKSIIVDEPYYYYFGRISFHKRLDILIEACARAGKRFYICGGAGLQAEMDKLHNQIATLDKEFPGTSTRIKLLGRLSNADRDRYLQGATGFLFAGKEDFGIAPIESLASGTPIIMYQDGGALDYLQPGINGVFSPEQTAESFIQAIDRFETSTFSQIKVRESALKFDKTHFSASLKKSAQE